MGKCPFVDRECTSECKAYDESKTMNCFVLHKFDRTNILLNFIEKKISGRD
ncbi:MAG: hypothetical protein U9Q69_05765 [Nanoarchaeota archaeon]|nr:hypothetical protein [Nanoarchaeota archaeon]